MGPDNAGNVKINSGVTSIIEWLPGDPSALLNGKIKWLILCSTAGKLHQNCPLALTLLISLANLI
jgi:hypothetical protein